MKKNNSYDPARLMGIFPGVLFILVYMVPISDKVLGVLGYFSCGVAALLIILMGQRWGLCFQESLFPSVGVLLSSMQILLRILLDYKINVLLIPGFLLLMEFFGVIYLFRKWRNRVPYQKKFVIRLILGSILVLGLLTIYSVLWDNHLGLDYLILWII